MKHTAWIIGVVVVVVGMTGYMAAAQEKRTAPAKPAKSATTRPHQQFGRLPLPTDQTISKQNSTQDKLQIVVTHSQSQDGKYVSYVRVVWGDLDNDIQKCGKEYYSNWDGSVTIVGGTGQAVHKIAFDDASRTTTRPATVGKVVNTRTVKNTATAKAGRGEPGTGSGRDELVTGSGDKIEWKAGVVGALDGLLIKITSDTPNISGTVKAGNFTVPFNITPGT